MAEEKFFKIKNSSGMVAGNRTIRGGYTLVWQADGTIEVPESMLEKFLKNPDNKLLGPVGGNKPEKKVAKQAATPKPEKKAAAPAIKKTLERTTSKKKPFKKSKK